MRDVFDELEASPGLGEFDPELLASAVAEGSDEVDCTRLNKSEFISSQRLLFPEPQSAVQSILGLLNQQVYICSSSVTIPSA